MNASINDQRKNAWRVLFEMILREFRLSENDLSKLTGVQQSTINRITRGETKQPYPSTIKRIEEKLNIRINDSDPAHFSFSKVKLDLLKTKHEIITKLETKNFPLLTKDMIPELKNIFTNEGILEPASIAARLKETIALPYDRKTGIASIVITDLNEPLLLKGDVVLFDYALPIQENDLIGWIGKDGNYAAGRYHRIDPETFSIEPMNKKYSEIIIKNKDIATIVKLVLSIRKF